MTRFGWLLAAWLFVLVASALGAPPGDEVVVPGTDAAGTPLAGARVVFSWRPGSDAEDVLESASVTDAGGVARIAVAERRTAGMLVVGPPAARWANLASSFLGTWTPKDATVALRRAVTIEGAVRDRDGRPVAFATVECDAAVLALGTHSRADGTFVVERVPEGAKARLSASSGPNSKLQRGDTADVTAGAKGIDLVVPASPPVMLVRPICEGRMVRSGFFDVARPGGHRSTTFFENGGIVLSAEEGPQFALAVRGSREPESPFDPPGPAFVWHADGAGSRSPTG